LKGLILIFRVSFESKTDKVLVRLNPKFIMILPR